MTKFAVLTPALALALAALAAAAGSQSLYSADPAASSTPPVAAAPALVPYETPAPVPVTTLLTSGEIKGPGYRLGPTADPTGMMYRFDLSTETGPVSAPSLQMLRIRLREIAAIMELQQLSQQQLFLQGMGEQLESTARATGKALLSPIKTLKQLPAGMKKFQGELQAQQIVGQVYGESGSPMYSQVKRDLAARLGVDPYSDNEELQYYMNETAKNQNGGKLIASIGTLVVGGGVGAAANLADINQEFQEIVRKKSAQQLQLDNRQALQGLGLTQKKADYFLTTPGYTAANCTAITRALVALVKVRGANAILDHLPANPTVQAVLFTQTQLQMAARYQQTSGGIVRCQFLGDTPVWFDAAGRALVFTPLEYLYWNREIDLGSQAVRDAAAPDQPMEYWISGSASPAAKDQLALRGITVKENALETLW